MAQQRCAWVGDEPIYVDYHDQEWGVPVNDDQTLFEFLTLEGFQAGLSWLTILKKRENFRQSFAGFNPAAVAAFDQSDKARLLANSGIVRNRLKIDAAITNAQAFLALQKSAGSFSEYIWNFVDGQPITNRWATLAEIPASTPLSEQISTDLKARGFRFVGPTIVYAHMQATGMVNDHTIDCFRHHELV
jgi:DNA-3-methyladenine glycosylase I